MVDGNKPLTLEVIGQPDPAMVDASRAAGEVLGALARLESEMEELVAVSAPIRERRIKMMQRRIAEMRDKLRPVAHIDVIARDRAEAEEREAMDQLSHAKHGKDMRKRERRTVLRLPK